MAKLAKKKQCFVVGPIGGEESDDRVHADWLLEEIILPVFETHFTSFEVTRADKMSAPGRIDAQVITSLLEADLVIADLTTLNPNAFYEIGIRHTIQKPIVHMHLEGQTIPFDIASFRSLRFQRKWPRDLKKAREGLKQAVDAAIDPDHIIDNPVTFSRGKIEISQSAAPTEKIFLQELETVSSRLDRIEQTFADDARSTRRDDQYGQLIFRIRSKNTTSEQNFYDRLTPVMSKLKSAELKSVGSAGAVLAISAEKNDLHKIRQWLTLELGEDFLVT